MRSRRPPVVVIGLALCVLAAGCIRADSDDDAGTTSTSESSDVQALADTDTTTSTVATTTTTAPPFDLAEVAWVVNDFDGLVDDQGRTIDSLTGIPGSNRPSVVRATDGSIYYVLNGSLWRRTIDGTEREEVQTDVDQVFGVTHDGEGNIIVNPFDDPEVIAEGAGSVRSNTALGEDGDFITADNGITVRILPPDADVDGDGYVTEFRSPARLEVERDGIVEWTVDAGGVFAPWLSLVDFDGRSVMMARYPTEPADPMMQHIVYDLRCSSGGRDCTRTFWARWGTAALVGTDVSSDGLNPDLLDVCPTMRAEIEPPAEMTDPSSFNEDFTAEDADAFRLAALQLSTCDPTGMGDPEQPGLLYVSGNDDPDENGWMWSGFARSLRGPFTEGEQDTWIWAHHPDGPKAVLSRDFGDAWVDLMPGRRFPEPLAATVTDDAVTLVGLTGDETAERLTAELQDPTEESGRRFSNWTDPSGAAHSSIATNRLISVVESMVADDQWGEAHLTADGVSVVEYARAEPTASQRTLGFTMADFASGGEGVINELPLADEVLLALGSEVVARRDVTELFRRSAWTLNSRPFAAVVGPFNVLDLVPSPSEVVVGPHARCFGPEAIPSPPELASYTRIGILPLEGSIDSCLEWSAVDLFVDGDGVIHGVALHLEEP